MKCNDCGKTASRYFTEYRQTERVPLCKTCSTRKARFGSAESIEAVTKRERPEAVKVAEEIAEIEALKARKQRTLDSWRNWFAQGGEDDKASPVSGYEIIGYCEADIKDSDKRLAKLRSQ